MAEQATQSKVLSKITGDISVTKKPWFIPVLVAAAVAFALVLVISASIRLLRGATQSTSTVPYSLPPMGPGAMPGAMPGSWTSGTTSSTSSRPLPPSPGRAALVTAALGPIGLAGTLLGNLGRR